MVRPSSDLSSTDGRIGLHSPDVESHATGRPQRIVPVVGIEIERDIATWHFLPIGEAGRRKLQLAIVGQTAQHKHKIKLIIVYEQIWPCQGRGGDEGTDLIRAEG